MSTPSKKSKLQHLKDSVLEANQLLEEKLAAAQMYVAESKWDKVVDAIRRARSFLEVQRFEPRFDEAQGEIRSFHIRLASYLTEICQLKKKVGELESQLEQKDDLDLSNCLELIEKKKEEDNAEDEENSGEKRKRVAEKEL
jgi:chromosome segregation ATPase